MTVQSREERDELYASARQKWGKTAQLAKAAEEFCELAAAVNRLQNDQHEPGEVLEEMADAKIMLEQLDAEYTDGEFESVFQEAVDDLQSRVGGEPQDE